VYIYTYDNTGIHNRDTRIMFLSQGNITLRTHIII